MRLTSFIFYSSQTPSLSRKRKRRTHQDKKALYKMATAALKEVEQKYYEDYLVRRFMFLSVAWHN
jgi:transcriptional regulatory protein LevR